MAKVVINDPFLPVTISVGRGAAFKLKGRLTFESWFGLKERVYISLGTNSVLNVAGDFNLGPGCRIIVGEGGQLEIGGRKKETASGITERSMIMVRKKVTIGTDLLCAWGAFITDCDWHDTIGFPSTEETVIGNHVWITPHCSVLKGSRIGDDCILATGTVTHKAAFPDGSLIGGIPGKVLGKGRSWSRDLT